MKKRRGWSGEGVLDEEGRDGDEEDEEGGVLLSAARSFFILRFLIVMLMPMLTPIPMLIPARILPVFVGVTIETGLGTAG